MHEGHRERLRQAFLQQNGAALHDHQLLELLLSYSIPRADTNPLAHTLLQKFGSLQAIFQANAYELMQVEGAGEKTAILLSLVGVMLRRTEAKGKTVRRLSTPMEAIEYCRSLFCAEKYEAMYILSLDKNFKLLYCEKISSGTLNETAVYPRIVVESALRHSANSVLLTHNHPSGDANPSVQDVDTTMLILKALEPIGIKLHDHIIIGKDHAFSMTRNAIIEAETDEAPLAAVAEKAWSVKNEG